MNLKEDLQKRYRYPRRRLIRGVLRAGIDVAAALLLQYRVEGRENLPKGGPLLIVCNHFHFLDTIAPIHSTRYPLEFIGDAEMPMAPAFVKFLPRLWDTLRIRQGTPNLESMRAAEAVLSQNGVLAIYPEGHVHQPPLQKPLAGASYLALRLGVPILPIATYSEDAWQVFGTLRRKRRRARVLTRIGQVFGPLGRPTDGTIPAREEVVAAGERIMQELARLLPPQARGIYGEDASV